MAQQAQYASWRDEWTHQDVLTALAQVNLTEWRVDHWSDGDMQLMHKGPIPIEDLLQIQAVFNPRRMTIDAVADEDARPPIELAPGIVVIGLSWYAP